MFLGVGVWSPDAAWLPSCMREIGNVVVLLPDRGTCLMVGVGTSELMFMIWKVI